MTGGPFGPFWWPFKEALEEKTRPQADMPTWIEDDVDEQEDMVMIGIGKNGQSLDFCTQLHMYEYSYHKNYMFRKYEYYTNTDAKHSF